MGHGRNVVEWLVQSNPLFADTQTARPPSSLGGMVGLRGDCVDGKKAGIGLGQDAHAKPHGNSKYLAPMMKMKVNIDSAEFNGSLR